MAGGYNIGTVTPRIWFLSQGPFYGQPKQEISHYYDQETARFIKGANIEVLPFPIRGVRLAEEMQNYDNFIYSDKYLEDATYVQDDAYDSEAKVEDTTPTTRTQSTQAAAKERAAIITANISSGQKQFFTWNVSTNMFGQAIGKDFDDPENLCFSYALPTRPNDKAKAQYLTPFFTRNTETRSGGALVHWGVKTARSLPLNQPFEVVYYYNGRTHNVPLDGYDASLAFQGMGFDTLGSSGYLGLEFGIGNTAHYLLMLVADSVPKLFLIKGRTAVFIDKYDNPDILQRLFDENSKEVTVKFECVSGSFIINSNLFSNPWVVQGLPTTTARSLTSAEKTACPIKYTHRIGSGPISLYGGNVQAGFAFRPVQYVCNSRSSSNSYDFGALGAASLGLPSLGDIGGNSSSATGGFDTPMVTFSSVTGSSPVVRASLTLKGAGDNVSGSSYGNILMADAESISGAESAGRFFGDPDVPRGLSRRIKVSIKKQRATSSAVGTGLYDVYAHIDLTPSNVSTYGWTIPCGRSPYIWMTRLYSPSKLGASGKKKYDVTVDTLSLNLSYNATSYNEIVQTGSLKILNPLVINKVRGTRECNNGISDYQQFMNRAVYVKIGCHWEGGYGLKGTNDWMFEGMTVGATVDIEAGRQIVTFKLADYMNVLEQSKFELSPYYDGMIARLAVKDIVEQTGLPASRMYYNTKKLGLTGRLSSDYVLPFLNPLNEPQFKFADGSSFKEAILRLAKYDFKTIYWDRNGDFHYDDGPDIYGSAVPRPNRRFYSSPRSTQDPSLVVWNSTTLGRNINDVYNVLRVDSIDRNINVRVTANARYYAGITNPNAVGYLGFRKMLLVRDPALGALSAVKRYVRLFQQNMHIPPRTIRFETFGRYDVKPLDIVTLDSQLVRVLNITYDIEAASNKFWMTVDGEWYDSFTAGSAVGGQANTNPNYFGSSGS